MDSKSKILLICIISVLLGSLAWKFNVFILKRDFTILGYVSCNPDIESCFSWICEEGDEECDMEPYRKIRKIAANIPVCSPYETETCRALSCGINEEGCEIIRCSEETLEDGEMCIYKSAL